MSLISGKLKAVKYVDEDATEGDGDDATAAYEDNDASDGRLITRAFFTPT